MLEEGGLNRAEPFWVLYRADALPGSAQILSELEVNTPPAALRAGGAEDASVVELKGLVLGGSAKAFR